MMVPTDGSEPRSSRGSFSLSPSCERGAGGEDEAASQRYSIRNASPTHLRLVMLLP